jgi:hypothetical protein
MSTRVIALEWTSVAMGTIAVGVSKCKTRECRFSKLARVMHGKSLSRHGGSRHNEKYDAQRKRIEKGIARRFCGM